MKYVAYVVVVILAISSILIGKIHWNDKLSTYAGAKSQLIVENKPNVEKKSEVKVASDEYQLNYTKNLPQEVIDKIKTSIESQKPINFVIVGSKSTMTGKEGWTTLLKSRLIDTYGEKVLNIKIHQIIDKSSNDIIEEKLYEDLLGFSPDIVLLEPFMLMDNGVVGVENRLINIDKIINEIKTVNPDTYIFLQPANPLYNATHYPKEVDKLKQYAEENGFTYLDHWQAWPKQDSDELKEYLTIDPTMSLKSIPNNKGNEVWAEFLTQYFISE